MIVPFIEPPTVRSPVILTDPFTTRLPVIVRSVAVIVTVFPEMTTAKFAAVIEAVPSPIEVARLDPLALVIP